MSGKVTQLRSQIREQASNQQDAGLKRLLDGILADIDGNGSHIPDYKREDVLKQLKTVLDGGGSAPDKQHAVGEIRARWTTLGNIFAPELADVMAKHRKFVQKERSNDEANEPAYIDEVEKRFGIQIHGDPGKDAVKIFLDSLARLMPYEKDIVELIPSIDLSGQGASKPKGSFMASVNVSDFVLRMDGRLDTVVIAHELTHHKEALVNLREAIRGEPLLQKRLLKINPPDRAETVARPDMSVAGTEDEKNGKKIERIKAKFAVSPELEKLLRKLFSSGFEPIETDDKNVFLRWTRIAEAIFKAEFPDPEKPWRLQDWIEISLRLQRGSFSMPNELIENYMAMSAAEDDSDWEGMDRKEIEKYLKSRIVEKLSKKFGISGSVASYVVESEWLIEDVRNASDGNRDVITHVLNAIESLPDEWRPFLMWVVIEALGNTGASKNISEDDIKQLAKLVNLCEGRLKPVARNGGDVRTITWKDIFAISLGKGYFKTHFDSLSNLVTNHSQLAGEIEVLLKDGFDPSVILRSINGDTDAIETICRSSIELFRDVPEKKAVFLRSVKEVWPEFMGLRNIEKETVAKLFSRGLIEASDIKLVVDEYFYLEYSGLFEATTIPPENVKYLIRSFTGVKYGSPTHEIIRSYLDNEKLRPGETSFDDVVKELTQEKESKKTQETEKTESTAPAETEFDLSVDGFAGRYGMTVEDGYGRKIIEPLAMGLGYTQFVGREQEASARAVAKKLARITKDTTDDSCDFTTLPLKSVFEYLLYILSSDDVDIETGLEEESPELKGKIDSMRSWWMGAALYLCPSAVSWFTGLGESELMAFRKIVKRSNPLSIGDLRRMHRQSIILGWAPIDELDIRPEQLSTIVAFYRASREDFVRKVFEKDGQGKYLHPKTIEKVILCQEYGFLPAVL